jgi:hypothetical protein
MADASRGGTFIRHLSLKGLSVLARIVIVPLLVALVAAPALAKPTVIAELGSAPLLGTSTSTAQMRSRVAENREFVSAAVHKLGLTSGQYAQFSEAIASSHVAWVTVPRHLDAMTWRSGSHVYVLHDVIIPARTNGWEVDLRSAGERIAIFMPAACGNVSVVRTALPAVAYHRAPPVVVPPAPVVATAVVPPPVVPDDTPAAPVVVAQSEFPPAPAVHHTSPLFLAPLLFGLAALSGVVGGGPVATVPVGCP